MRILYDSKHAARMALGVARAKRNIDLKSCNDLLLRAKNRIFASVHHVFGHAGNAGNECADIAASFGTSGFISERNTPAMVAHQTLLRPGNVSRRPSSLERCRVFT